MHSQIHQSVVAVSQLGMLKIKRLPDSPGVYFFFGRRKEILYIGRATSLRGRVRSYFGANLLETRGPWILKMLSEVRGIDYTKTDSVLEAILLEADLIKKFQPPYNTRERDDKSFNCNAITDEEFPRVLLVRQKDLSQSSLKIENCKLKTVYGPFPHGVKLREAMQIIRRIFPWRDEKCIFYASKLEQGLVRHQSPRRHSYIPRNVGMSGRACFNRQIGLCPGVCTGEISGEEYRRHIRRLMLFLSGKKSRIVKELEREMKSLARRQEFERADERKRQLFALKHIQDVSLLGTTNYQLPTTSYRIEAYDLSHFGGKEIVGAMSVVEGDVGVPSEYRRFRIRTIRGPHEVVGLREILSRRLQHREWRLPDAIAVDGNEVQKRAAETVVRKAGLAIPVIAIVKDERHRAKELLGKEALVRKHRSVLLLAHSEAHRFALAYHRDKRGKAFRMK